ncbi:hypothetical protein CLAFUW4_03014 [Fulvia fulva]|uniref:DUF4604 domain-containing protein n=1 Tax=Passalora fulva TaxID=5499 RepID=A0A9Q8L9L2_PASFU|nr:uncharacterized protein CLAFUR5_02999 [Fulvia fulva]KAK4631609.1 hypothetical protein CLAFUR4_03007 [Fulvia fulva]KAK4632670.1 hypothetical protein CLAFUR0_03010 [Fulvia fulva]UJO13317.1 hypothetical protein CLAFUR5_02999 [Fulvia fulva]WPV10458.1 hypothetical protein CLAFUW4_03014 [Fulvia fulva]WPV26318.1 hypothetical protein CLAFUW7_03011 [Fulvia fulva]
MSDKIKSKDLSYDSALPPFLQRLHDQNAGRGDTDRHERAIARPKRAKDPNEDDGPTVVDDSGETLSKAEVEKLTADTAPKDDAPGVSGDIDPDAEPKVSGALPAEEQSVSTKASGAHRTDQKVTDGTAQKKRKLGKAIGDDENAATEDSKDQESSTKVFRKVKKKAKPVKLTFDDDEET